MAEIEARIPNRRRDLATVAAMTERFGAENKIGVAIVNDINVALDEVLTNIVSYAYSPGERAEILVRLAIIGSEIVAEIEDGGRPFDPLQAPPPDLSKPLRDRKVGGLGIHFIRSLMDEVSYQRIDGRNRLRLSKKLQLQS